MTPFMYIRLLDLDIPREELFANYPVRGYQTTVGYQSARGTEMTFYQKFIKNLNFGIWSGSTLYAQAGLSQYLGLLWFHN